MARTPRTLHTPGEPAASEPQAAAETEQSAASEPVAEPTTEPEKPKVKASKEPKVLTRADYLTMHSSEVDPTTLQRAVLCKDGWVTPLPKDKDGKPQTHLVRSPGEA